MHLFLHVYIFYIDIQGEKLFLPIKEQTGNERCILLQYGQYIVGTLKLGFLTICAFYTRVENN